VSVSVGQAFDLSAIGNAAAETWICFATDPDNPQIWRLAPATDQPVSESTVRVRSSDGEIRWLTLGVEIDVHEADLVSHPLAGMFAVARDLDEVPGFPSGSFPDKRLEDLKGLASRLESVLHATKGPQDLPQVDDCQLVELAPEAGTAVFRWNLDVNRTYRLKREGGRWTLQQYYDTPDAIDFDRAVPLRLGDVVIHFAPPGFEAELPEPALSHLVSRLGLEAVTPSRPRRPAAKTRYSGVRSDVLAIALSPRVVAATLAFAVATAAIVISLAPAPPQFEVVVARRTTTGGFAEDPGFRSVGPLPDGPIIVVRSPDRQKAALHLSAELQASGGTVTTTQKQDGQIWLSVTHVRQPTDALAAMLGEEATALLAMPVNSIVVMPLR
jgi:hypothetical protein